MPTSTTPSTPHPPQHRLQGPLWDAHDVRRADTGTLEVGRPNGRPRFTLVTLQGVATPGFRFNAHLPTGPWTSPSVIERRASHLGERRSREHRPVVEDVAEPIDGAAAATHTGDELPAD